MKIKLTYLDRDTVERVMPLDGLDDEIHGEFVVKVNVPDKLAYELLGGQIDVDVFDVAERVGQYLDGYAQFLLRLKLGRPYN